ncbi:uncharacterized protein LOC143349639 [Colletes latitarsis]|uniref:uncharacterized protein LOC143349639 n=1 Tax=Colletes latitarsis TaxID=2605962 RepID=UPI0040371BB5
MPPKRKRRQRRAKPAVEARDLKKEALAREIKLSAFNTDRYRQLWREVLMRMTMPDIERKIQVAWQTLDHALDLKDYRISLLLDGLQETEDQRRKADGAHAETIDLSFETHETRLKSVDAFFRENIETAFADKIYDFENINYHRNKDEALLVKINLLVNLRNENAFTAAKSNAISKVDAFAEDGKNERRLTAAQLQKQLEDLWDNLRSVFLDYRKSITVLQW